MRELLGSHEQEIVDPVILRLSTENRNYTVPNPPIPHPPLYPTPGTQPALVST